MTTKTLSRMRNLIHFFLLEHLMRIKIAIVETIFINIANDLELNIFAKSLSRTKKLFFYFLGHLKKPNLT